MTHRDRNAILVRLADGPAGAVQRQAIESLTRKGESLSAAARRVLLRAADRADLDVEGPDVIERAKAGGLARRFAKVTRGFETPAERGFLGDGSRAAEGAHLRILECREGAVLAVNAIDGAVPMEWTVKPGDGFGSQVQELEASGVPVFRLTTGFKGYVFKIESEWLVEGYALTPPGALLPVIE